MKLMCLLLLISSQIAFALTTEQQTIVYESYKSEFQGKIGDSIKKMQTLYLQSPDDYLVNYRLGWLYSLDKKYTISNDHYKKAGKIKPESLEPWLALSSLSINIGDWNAAKADSIALMKRNNLNYYGNLRFITASIKLKEYSPALEKVNLILSHYPLDPILLEQRAYILSELGKKDEANKAVKDLLLISPSNSWALSYIAK